ncbi:MAG TPA: hypothetical protein VE242_05400 [Chthoniobacterales bacterium]|nr:hypothetical protein [Chthoniobacterales bacterium]
MVLNNAGEVTVIIYFSQLMSEQGIGNLLAANAPKAAWQKRVKDGETLWDGFEDGFRKYAAYSWTIDDPNADADMYGINVLKIETTEFEDLRNG